MAVHRISDRAELALANIIARTGDRRKRPDIISELLVEYEAGLSFPVQDMGVDEATARRNLGLAD